MKFAISNIAWDSEYDVQMYKELQTMGVDGLEIAPTRILSTNPYDRTDEAVDFANKIELEYGLVIPSMQSIWYGKTENIWKSESDRQALYDYTKKAIDFAAAIGCKNLVFGCPRNRAYINSIDESVGIAFFKDLGEYAYSKGTCIGMEANPTIYNTNYINTTEQAISLIKVVNSEGFKLNLDMGTIIQNEESLEVLKGNENLINHVHVSEPGLRLIEERDMHGELATILKKCSYEKYVSVEMSKQENIELIIDIISYIKNVFE